MLLWCVYVIDSKFKFRSLFEIDHCWQTTLLLKNFHVAKFVGASNNTTSLSLSNRESHLISFGLMCDAAVMPAYINGSQGDTCYFLSAKFVGKSRESGKGLGVCFHSLTALLILGPVQTLPAKRQSFHAEMENKKYYSEGPVNFTKCCLFFKM